MREIGAKTVDVGFLKTAKKYPPGDPGHGRNVAEVAAKNAYYPPPHVPQRNFMFVFEEIIGRDYKQPIKQMLSLILSGRVESPKAMRNLGIRGVRDMRSIIERWADPPNALKTIKKKGFNDPLIHTRHMYRSVNYRVNK